jgi:energy-coupling factor transport system permease protein
MTTAAETSGAVSARALRPDRVAASALHPVAWAAWLAGALAMVFLTSNPLYTTMIALASLVVYAAHRDPTRRGSDYVLAGSIMFATLTVPLNLLTGSTGATHVASLPALTTPGWLGAVTFGGDVTAESLAYAAARAMAIIALLAAVWAFNVGADHFRLLRYVPAGLAQLGVIVSVGLMLVPATLARGAALREARLVRGHHGRGPAAVVALALPLLSDALERSVQRAESLDARGFGRLATAPRPWESLLAVGGLAVSTVGAFASSYTGGAPAALCMIAGMAALAAVLLRQSGRSTAVRLHAPRPAAPDVLVMTATAASVAIFAALRIAGAGGLAYLPFPTVFTPRFAPLPAIACVLLIAPALYPSTLRGAR